MKTLDKFSLSLIKCKKELAEFKTLLDGKATLRPATEADSEPSPIPARSAHTP